MPKLSAMTPFLRHRWFQLCDRENISAKMEMWTAISSMYTENSRSYHNLKHIEYCLKRLDQWPDKLPQRSAIEIALWFHDIIFDTVRADNESASAGLAKHYLGDHPLAEQVFGLILATRHHSSTMTASEHILCDIDLSILSAKEPRYNKYANDVKKEFLGLPKEIFCISRINVLQKFLNREFIYRTDHYREKYEPYAQANLTREIESLKNELKSIEKARD